MQGLHARFLTFNGKKCAYIALTHLYLGLLTKGHRRNLLRVSNPTTRRNILEFTELNLNLICEISNSGFDVKIFVKEISACEVQRKNDCSYSVNW